MTSTPERECLHRDHLQLGHASNRTSILGREEWKDKEKNEGNEEGKGKICLKVKCASISSCQFTAIIEFIRVNGCILGYKPISC